MADHALAEQLEGLTNLLKAVGIDSVDNREVKKASIALKNQGSGAPIVFPPDIPESRQLNDDQIQAMILKLQQAQAQAPGLMEALEEYIDERGLGSGINGSSQRGTKKKTKKKKAKGGGTYQPEAFAQSYEQKAKQHLKVHNQHQLQQQQQQYYEEDEAEYYAEEAVEEPPQNNDHDDYDEEEDEDDFDEDADYPMVGPGVSDDVSVVSDMTTPTVVSSIHVNDEEQYADILPSMYVKQGGPPMMIQPQKKKNLVAPVGALNRAGVPMRVGPAGAAAPPNVGGMMIGGGSQHSATSGAAGGAAAKRRQAYQQTMSRLHQNPYGTTMAGPSVNPNIVPQHHNDDEHSINQRHLPSRSASGDGMGNHHLQQSARSGNSMAGDLAHQSESDFSFEVMPEGWNPFGEQTAEMRTPEPPALDESGRGKKKKTTKAKGTAKAKAAAEGTTAKAKTTGAAPKSPKGGKKKKAVGGTTIDRDGFLASTDPNGLSKSQHTAGSKKKVVKKKVAKATGEGKPTKKSPTSKSPKSSAN